MNVARENALTTKRLSKGCNRNTSTFAPRPSSRIRLNVQHHSPRSKRKPYSSPLNTSPASPPPPPATFLLSTEHISPSEGTAILNTSKPAQVHALRPSCCVSRSRRTCTTRSCRNAPARAPPAAASAAAATTTGCYGSRHSSPAGEAGEGRLVAQAALYRRLLGRGHPPPGDLGEEVSRRRCQHLSMDIAHTAVASFITSMQFYAQDQDCVRGSIDRRWRTDRQGGRQGGRQTSREAGGQGGRGAGRQSPGEWDYQCLEANHVFSVHYTTGLATV